MTLFISLMYLMHLGDGQFGHEPLDKGARQGGHANARFLEGFLDGSLTASAS